MVCYGVTSRELLCWQRDMVCYGVTSRELLWWQRDIVCYGVTSHELLWWQRDIVCYGVTSHELHWWLWVRSKEGNFGSAGSVETEFVVWPLNIMEWHRGFWGLDTVLSGRRCICFVLTFQKDLLPLPAGKQVNLFLPAAWRRIWGVEVWLHPLPTSVLDWGAWQTSTPKTLTRRLGGLHSRSGRFGEKNLLPLPGGRGGRDKNRGQPYSWHQWGG